MYLSGDSLIFTLIAFGVGLWAAYRYIANYENILVIVVVAFLLAMFGTSLNVFLSQNLISALAIIGMLVILSQYLTGMSLTESFVILLVAWIIGSTLLNVI